MSMSSQFAEYNVLDLSEVNKKILEKWKSDDVFKKSMEIRQNSPSYIFYEGPPSANGMPGIHHVIARSIKDIFCRYKTMKGFLVQRKAGWDTHGLPVELGVEKKLGITKDDIGKKISVTDYNRECRTDVMKYTQEWEDLTEKMGYWVDMEHPYITCNNRYIETLWWLLRQLYNKGLLYKGYTIQPYSPAAGTGLSTHELNQPGAYRDVKDTTCVAMFRLRCPTQSPTQTLPSREGFKSYNTADVVTYGILKENSKNRRKNPTEAEAFLWKNLQGKQLEGYKFRREHVIGDCIVDFVCLSKQLVIEVDGGYHNEESQREFDKIRSEYLNSKGFKVIRFTNEEVLQDTEKTLETIKHALHQSPLEGDLGGFYFLAWTTTPWTLPSNTALCVGPNIDYVFVKTENPYNNAPCAVILAKDRISAYFGEKKIENYEIIGEVKGAELAGSEYEQLFDWVKPAGDAFRVITGDFVTTEDGTGIVHIAPTFGADDDRVARQNGIAPALLTDKNGKRVPMVDLTGKFYRIEDLDKDFADSNIHAEEYEKWAGRYVKNEYKAPLNPPSGETSPAEGLSPSPEGRAGEGLSLDIDICMDLKARGLVFKIEKHTHNYPHCWRTDKPVLYYPLDSWFIRSTACRDRMIELNNTINWKPQSTGSGRFGKWLENLQDWNLSRSRYWGTPLPIWRTDDGLEELCIGSVEELYNKIEQSVSAGFMKTNPYRDAGFMPGVYTEENYNKIDLHRPGVDEITLVSEKGQPMKREADLIDVWFDSGAMPCAQVHYPFENKESFEKKDVYPADFIAEGVDQTRGWFFTLHAIACMVFDNVSFKNVVSNGLVLDRNGNKMSKRLGNAVDPFAVIEKYGSDPLRWYMITNAPPWDNLKFDTDGIEEVRRKFFGTLYNTYSFFALYANVDGFNGGEPDVPVHERPEIDRWILSLLNSLIKDVDAYYADYEPTRAGRAVSDFVNDHLSNWYVRLNRRRFWGGGMTTDKRSAYQTLYTCLETVSRLMAPISPFYADRLFSDLTSPLAGGDRKISVHIADFPKFDESVIDKSLEERMQLAQTVSSMVLALRRKVGIKVRQPLQSVMIPALNDVQKANIKAVETLILNEVNVKELKFADSGAGILVKRIKPDFKKLGPRYGKIMKQLAATLQTMSQEEIAEFEKAQVYICDIEGQKAEITLNDVEIISEDIPGWLAANEGNITIALDITVTENLRKEGIARELVNRIQNIRKSSGLDITDKITVKLSSSPQTDESVREYEDYITKQVLALSLEIVENPNAGTELDFDDFKLRIEISKV
jgi:isoleucyl-tRNA synthetase